MSDVQISVTEADVQIAVIDQENTQLALAAPDENQVTIAVPGVQGPIGATGTIAGAQDGTAAAPGISFLADTDTGIYRVATNSIGVSTGGVSRFVIDSAGQIETVGLGSAAAPAYSWFGDQNTGIYSPGADQLAISTNGTGRLFVDSTGRVGVNTSTFADARDSLIVSPAASQTSTFFTVKAGSTSGNGWLFFGDTDSNSVGGIAYEHANDAMAFRTNGSERLRIDSSGRLGLGTSSPTSLAHLSLASNTTYDATNLNLATHALNITNTSTTASTSSSLIFQSTGSGGSAIGAIALVNTGANAGALTFATRGGASATPERMRIDSSGRVGIGTTSPSYIFHALTSDTTSAAFRNPGAANTQILIGNTAGDTAIRTTSAGDALIYSDTGKSLGLGTNGATTRLHITSAGLVGIGTTSPSVALQVSGQIRNNNGYLIDNGTNAGFLTADGSNINIGSSTAAKGLAFFTGATSEAARLDASGRLLVGTSTARSNLGGGAQSARLQIEGTGGDTARISQIQNANSSNAIQYIFAKSRGTAVGSNTIVQSGDGIGQLSFEGSDGTNFVQAASITGAVDGTPGANDMPGRLVFSTTADGAASPTERMRLDSSGRVGIGTASPRSLLNVRVDTNANTASGSASLVLSNRSTSLATGNMAGGIFADMYRDISDPAYAAGIWFNRIQSTGNLDSAGEIVFGVQSVSSGAGTPPERMRIDSSGRLLVGTSANTGGSLLQINDNRIRVATAKTPASATDTGATGEICWDANYIYVCTATNTWKRAALSTW